MKPLLFTLLSISISITQLHGQCQIPNGDFEQWEDGTDTIEFEFGFELIDQVFLPTNYFPLSRVTFLAIDALTEPFLDTGVADVELFSTLKMVSPGANGSGTAAQLMGDSLQSVMDLILKMECGQRPTSLQGFYRYSGSEGDSLIISALFDSEKSPNDIATADFGFQFKTQGGPDEFTLFDIPINFEDDSYIPSFASIKIFTEKDPNSTTQESFFEVDEFALVGTTTSQRDFVVEAHELVAPNPFDDYLDLDMARGLQRVTITDLQGRQVMTAQNPGNRMITQNLAAGIYFMRAHTANEVFVQRLIKR